MGASEKIGYFQLERIGDSILFPVNGRHNYGKSPLLIDKSTINGHFQ
jgi:hypothetical protein